MNTPVRPLAKKFRDRLLKVAQALREAAPARRRDKKFTMSSFAHTCGTPACALGHFAARRDLQNAFRLAVNDGVEVIGGGSDYYDVFDRAETYFGINENDVDELFGGDGCGNAQTPVQAARFIERFVAKRTPANG